MSAQGQRSQSDADLARRADGKMEVVALENAARHVRRVGRAAAQPLDSRFFIAERRQKGVGKLARVEWRARERRHRFFNLNGTTGGRTRLGNLRRAPRCEARTRAGPPCKCPAIRGRRRCRLHGGLNPGAPRGARNGNFTDGTWSLRRSRSVGGFGHLFGPLASLRTHHDSEWRYSEWSGCQYRAPPSRASQIAAHQRRSGERISARRRDQSLVG